MMRLAHKQIDVSPGPHPSAPSGFFERLIVSLLVKMGYSGSAADTGRAIGHSGDGVIDQDALGPDRKRYEMVTTLAPVRPGIFWKPRPSQGR